jgi:catecholate siderophore receptor
VKQPRSLRTPNNRAHLVSASTLAVSIAALGVSLPAAAENTELNAIVVEGKVLPGQNPNSNPDSPYKAETLDSSKHARPIAETPKSITVITKESIEDSGATDLADVLKTQPGITIGTGEGGNAFGDRFIIRGFEARNDVFVDGLRDPGVTTRETFAVEQIEVSKGPSSSFAGRGTTGGAINNVTKKPGQTDFTTLEVGLGTDSKQRYTLDANRSLSNDLSVRFNALYADRDVPAREGSTEQRQGLALALEHRTTSRLTLSADLYHLRGDEVPDGGVPWDATTGKPVPGRKFYGQNGRDFLNFGADIFTFGVKYDLGYKSRIENITRYGVTSNDYIITIPGLTTDPAPPAGTPVGVNTPGVFARASSQNRNQENTYIGNQTNWVNSLDWGQVKHDVVVGVEFSREEAINIPYADALRSPNAGDPLNPNNNAWQQQGGSYTVGSNLSEIVLNSMSVYALDTATLNKDWEVFSGLRYDTFDYTFYTGPNDYQGTTRGGNSDGFLNGHVGLTYSPWDNGNVYVSYSTSSNASGEQLDSTSCDYGGLCGTGDGLKPERNRSIEVGTKWQFLNNRLLLTGALFDITKSDVLSQMGRGGPITQVGELKVQGMEVGLTGKLTDALSISSGMAILDTRITQSDTPTEGGQPFPNTAEKSANVQTRYQLNDQWAFGATATYKGEIFGGSPNGPVTGNSIESSTVYDLMAEYKFSQDLKLRLNVLNALDEEYYTALYRSGAPFTYVGEGRSATVTMVMNF